MTEFPQNKVWNNNATFFEKSIFRFNNIKKNEISFKPVSYQPVLWQDKKHMGSSCVLHLSASDLSPVVCDCSKSELNLQEQAQ